MTPKDLIRFANTKMQDALGRNLIAEGWTADMGSNKMTKAIGRCFYNQKILRFSPFFLPHLTDEEIHEVVMHEIAHALTPGDGHGKKWKMACIKLGIKPKVKATLTNRQKIKSKYVVFFMNVMNKPEIVSHSSRQILTAGRYVNGRKSETLNKLICIKETEYIALHGNV